MTTSKLPGRSRKDKCVVLWEEIQGFYNRTKAVDKLQNLTVSMLSKGGVPKLRCNAAQCRALVPFAMESCARHLSNTDAAEEAMIVAANHLKRCYDALRSSADDSWKGILLDSSSRFAMQVVALGNASEDDKLWRVKPKMHLFLELCSSGSRPHLLWTYRDEDFGGTIAKMSRRRGGLLRPRATSVSTLTRFRIKSDVPRIRR